MSFFKKLIYGVVLCLAGCKPYVGLDDSLKPYALADANKNYLTLVERPAAELSREQLYNRALTLWGTPYRELNLPTSLGLAHVVVSGPVDGEVVVLLHGMNASSTMWYPNVAALSQHYRVYAIDDINGEGKSERTKTAESMAEVINWYVEVFDLLKIKQLNLVGASKGGWTATNIALRNPERIKRLVLLSPAQTFTWIKPSLGIVSNVLFALNPERNNLHAALESMSSNVDGINSLYVDQYYRTTQQGGMPDFLIDMQPFEDSQLQKITMPTLVLIGDNDIINNQESLDNAKQLIPHVKVEMLKNAGHFLNVDQSARVNEAVIAFMQGK